MYKLSIEQKYRIACRKLREAYESFDDLNIKELINRVYENGEDILDIQEEYDILIKNKDSYDSSILVQGASWDRDLQKMKIYLTDLAISFIETRKEKDRLLKQMVSACAHEDTHKQQDKNNSFEKVLGQNNEKYIRGEDDYDGYLSQYFEIDAFARGIGEELIHILKDKNTILSYLRQNKWPTSFSEDTKFVINEYKSIGGSTYKKFLKRIYEYIIQRFKPKRESLLKKRIEEKTKLYDLNPIHEIQ